LENDYTSFKLDYKCHKSKSENDEEKDDEKEDEKEN
jgi:hypothetical protein